MRYLIGLVSCKEIVRRNVRYSIELRAVSLLGDCEVFDRRRLLGEMIGI